MVYMTFFFTSLAVMVVAMCVFGFLSTRGEQRERTRQLELKTQLVERALESGAIDDDMSRELLDVVTGKADQAERSSGTSQAFVLGWLGLFAGLAMIGTWAVGGNNEWYEPGVLTSLVSFGLLSLPIAMREMRRHRDASGVAEEV